VGAGGKCFKVWSSGTSGGTEPSWDKTFPAMPSYPYGITTDGTVKWVYMGDGTPIYENVNFWQYNNSFDGTIGVGCGTLDARPTTCTTGVAYWATNQRCDNLDGMVGASPSTPISGTLYKCTSTDTWEPYYTPYTYPHPLRRLGNQLSGGVVVGGTF